jgi:hypothetical protein
LWTPEAIVRLREMDVDLRSAAGVDTFEYGESDALSIALTFAEGEVA